MRSGHLNQFSQSQDPPGTIRGALDRASVVQTLKDQQNILQSAMDATKDGFLTLGQQMEAMSKMADTIAKLAREILETTSGTGEKGVLCEATRTFEKVFARAGAKQSHYAKIVGRLREIGSRTALNHKARQELARALFTFGPLAMGFRIEIARLDDDDAGRFQALAAAILNAQAQAQSSADRYFTGLAGILQFVGGMQTRLAEYSDRLAQGLSRTRRSLNEHLSSLNERWSHAAEAGAVADGAVRDIVAQIGKIVVAAQYQDIAHQQIEHISTAIDEILREFDDAGNTPTKCETELVIFARHAGLVQCHQMDAVADEVEKASQTIIGAMNGILDSAGSLVCSESTTKTTCDDLLDAFGDDIRSITELDEAGAAISNELAAWIGPAVQGLSVFATDLQTHSTEIRLTALNAQVYACRVEHGAVLDVLATELRVAADKSLSVITRMSRFVEDVISDLSGDLDQSRAAAIAEGNQLRQETGRVTTLLDQVQTDVRHNVEKLAPLYKSLSDSTQITISSIDLQGGVVDPVRRAKMAIEALVNSFEVDEQEESHFTIGDRLAALRQSYTMESERNAHDVVAKEWQQGGTVKSGTESARDDDDKVDVVPDPMAMIPAAGGSPCAEGAQAVLVAAGADPLGENVELF